MSPNLNKFKLEDPLLHRAHFQQALVNWYRQEGRILPWRATPGHDANPYHEWLSEIMLQQTVVKTVIPYFLKFIARWPSIQDLALAPLDEVMKEWAGLGYYSRARNLHRCAVIIAQDYQGRFPTHERELRKLPGIGPYTAAAISAIAFGRPCTVVDGNVERVMARLFNVAQPLKEAKGELYQYAQQLNSAVNESYHPGDFAQAVMDLGATVCTPSRPACLKCPVSQYCQAYHLNKQDHLPRRAVKSAKPQRYGVLYFCENSAGELLFERRPEKGLLGGMIGLPGSEWQGQDDISMKGEDKQGQSLIEHYYLKHTFTHFELHLKAMTVNYEDISLSGAPVFWHPLTEYDKLGLPNLYKKALQQYFTFKGL